MDIITEIKHRLNEELGVSDIVSKASSSILSLIIKDSKTLPRKDFKNGKFDYSFQGKIIQIYYDLYYVENYEDINKIVPSNKGFSRKENKTTYILKTSIVYVKTLNKYIDANGTIQHELEHIFQMIKSGSTLLSKQSSINLYKTSEQLRDNYNIYYKIVGTVVYYACKFEKDAFINAIYKQIMDNPYTNPYETLKKTITYQNIQVINKCVIETSIYKPKFQKIVETYFNKNYQWFYNLSKKVVKEYTKKIGKIFAKAQQDLNNNNVFLDGGLFGNGENKL